jgi:phenylpropionate dioxygenase-like ring-hydroxylating dioxygenase large terminal subunit
MFPRDEWWVIAASADIRRKPVKLRRFGRELALWRDAGGAIHCVDDLCPHRGASLAAGRVVDGELECPFHGFRFDGTGRCTLAPCEGGPEAAPSHVVARHYEIREGHGLVYLWWGDGEAIGEPPWFDAIDGRHRGVGTRRAWDIHYMRAIEVQLDWAHLPWVHPDSIGRGFDPRIHLALDADESQIRVWDKRMEDTPGEPRFYLHFLFPNQWMNPIGKKMFGFLAFAPVDEHRTLIYVRTYQRIVRVPGLDRLFGWTMNVFNGYVLGQDEQVVRTQPSERTDTIRDERLVASDRSIAHYRKRMKRSLATASLPIAEDA